MKYYIEDGYMTNHIFVDNINRIDRLYLYISVTNGANYKTVGMYVYIDYGYATRNIIQEQVTMGMVWNIDAHLKKLTDPNYRNQWNIIYDYYYYGIAKERIRNLIILSKDYKVIDISFHDIVPDILK